MIRGNDCRALQSRLPQELDSPFPPLEEIRVHAWMPGKVLGSVHGPEGHPQLVKAAMDDLLSHDLVNECPVGKAPDEKAGLLEGSHDPAKLSMQQRFALARQQDFASGHSGQLRRQLPDHLEWQVLHLAGRQARSDVFGCSGRDTPGRRCCSGWSCPR